MKKIIALMLACMMIVGMFAVSAAAETSEKPDTIVVMAPPVTGSYLENLKV